MIMKVILKNFLRQAWHKTPFYRQKLKKLVAAGRIRQLTEEKILQEIFKNNLVILNGPFKGMGYIHRSSCSALFPKIIGSYEEPIANLIDDVVKNTYYDCIFDIGCAEGYYAVGLAVAKPDIRVKAYDIDPAAIAACRQLKQLNHVDNLEVLNEAFDFKQNLEPGHNFFLIDIEGHERALLDPKVKDRMRNSDILVEVHDHLEPNIGQKIVHIYADTHSAIRIYDYPYRKKNYNVGPLITNSHLTYNTLIDEKRPEGMSWLFLQQKMSKSEDV